MKYNLQIETIVCTYLHCSLHVCVRFRDTNNNKQLIIEEQTKIRPVSGVPAKTVLRVHETTDSYVSRLTRACHVFSKSSGLRIFKSLNDGGLYNTELSLRKRSRREQILRLFRRRRLRCLATGEKDRQQNRPLFHNHPYESKSFPDCCWYSAAVSCATLNCTSEGRRRGFSDFLHFGSDRRGVLRARFSPNRFFLFPVRSPRCP